MSPTLRRPFLLVVLTVLLLAACSSAAGTAEQSTEAPTVETAEIDSSTAVPQPTGSGPLSDLVVELPPAPIGFPDAEQSGPVPVGLRIDGLGVEGAPVVSVGVEDDGEMEIPPAEEVGWYQYGPAPGQPGSAVLAAHIAYDGQDGVFRRLDDLAVGSILTVEYDDGSTADFITVDKQQYDKQSLPFDSIFAREGAPSLALITCGGSFNPSVRSYEDNVVVYAEPVATS